MKHQSKLLAVSLFLFFAAVSQCLISNPADTLMDSKAHGGLRGKMKDHIFKVDDDLLMKDIYASGSSLPDCSHACGPCFPCKRVMVSFKCSLAESCPIVYRCMCRGRYYHVPSN